jgi:hypothetical protein
LTALVGSALPGPDSRFCATSVQIDGACVPVILTSRADTAAAAVLYAAALARDPAILLPETAE